MKETGKNKAALLLYVKGLVWSRQMKLTEALDLFINAHIGEKAQSTLRIYKHSCKFMVSFWGNDLHVNQMEYYQADEFRAYLLSYRRYSASNHKFKADGKSLSASTVRRVLGCCKAIFAWLVRMEKCERNPFQFTKMPKKRKQEPKAISPEDFDKLVEEAQSVIPFRKHNEMYIARDTAILMFFGSTACRVSGMSAARISKMHIGNNRGSIVITEKYPGGPKDRTVYLSERAVIAIMIWLDYRPPADHDYIFTNLEGAHKGERILENGIYQILKRMRERVNRKAGQSLSLSPITTFTNPHAFRHCCAREWLRGTADQKGMSLAELSKIMGCTQEVILEYYAIYADSEIQDVHTATSWIER